MTQELCKGRHSSTGGRTQSSRRYGVKIEGTVPAREPSFPKLAAAPASSSYERLSSWSVTQRPRAPFFDCASLPAAWICNRYQVVARMMPFPISVWVPSLVLSVCQDVPNCFKAHCMSIMFCPFQRVGIDSLNDEVYLAHLIHGRGNIETPIRGGTVLLEHGKGGFGLALGDVFSRSEEVRSVVSSTNLAPVSCVIVASCSAKVPRTPQSWHLRPRSSRRPALLSPQRILQTSVEAKRGGRANQVREEATGSVSQRTRLVNVLNRLRKKKKQNTFENFDHDRLSGCGCGLFFPILSKCFSKICQKRQEPLGNDRK